MMRELKLLQQDYELLLFALGIAAGVSFQKDNKPLALELFKLAEIVKEASDA